MPKKIKLGILSMLFLLLLTPPTFAYTTIVAYGDSLTDDGNTRDYWLWDGLRRLTDGAIWVETLAESFGSDLLDTAYAGATTGYDNPSYWFWPYITGLQWQIDNHLPSFDMESTLFTVWAGANDFFDGRGYENAAENIGLALEKLAGFGARDILTLNLPDIAYIPAYYNDAQGPGTTAAASGWTAGFNDALEDEIWAFASTHEAVDLYFLDVFGLFFDHIELDSNGNITNTLEWEALFWEEDNLHPSEIGHDLIAQAAYDTLQGNPVPIPGTFLLLVSGLVGLMGLAKKKNFSLSS